MRKSRKNAQPAHFFSLSQACFTANFLLVAVALLIFWPAAAEAQAGTASPGQSQASPQAQSQKNPQPESPSVTATQRDAANKQQSPSDASRQTNGKKDKPKPKHVYTNDDLSGLSGTISVVGSESSDSRSANGTSGAISRGNNPASSANKNEAYWRGKARAIKDQIAAVDQQIDRVNQEIAKSGPAAFDPTTGLQQNVIIVHDRNAELQRLQERKQNLEKQLDDLADEGRRAGADAGWFR